MADFQEWYGLDLLAIDLGDDANAHNVERASILAAQLPGASRTKRKANPLSSVDVVQQLLRRIDCDLQAIACGLGGGEPEPFLFDGEEEQARREAERNVRLSRGIAARFGLEGLEAQIG